MLTRRSHWPEYAIEAALLGAFMAAACGATAALEHPASPLRAAVPDPLLRRVLIGVAMGLTAAALVYSPWGRRSGAHMNPSLTLAFLRLGKLDGRDAAGYVAGQFAGASAVTALARVGADVLVGHPAVRYAVTVPGPGGVAVAFAAEAAISFGMMALVLAASNSERLRDATGALCGVLVATYIAVEAPLSGMSMNPARTLASALGANDWTALWVYFTAPPLGMLAAAEVWIRTQGVHRILCAKLHHGTGHRCIFHCGYETPAVPAASKA